MARIKVARSDLATEIEEYLIACRSRGVRPSTIKHAYGYSLRACSCHGAGTRTSPPSPALTSALWSASQLTSATAPRGLARLLSESTVKTYHKAVNQLLKWYADEHEGTAPKVKLLKVPDEKSTPWSVTRSHSWSARLPRSATV